MTLAILTGFILLLPPEVPFTADQFNTNAPLSAWKPFESRQTAVQEGSGRATVFSTVQACEATRQLWSSQWKTMGNQKLSNAYNSGRCVSQDDPALNQ
jgi:hypothetical protein